MLSFYEVSKPSLTNDHLIWHTGAREKTMQEYKTSHTGFLSQFPFGVFAFARLDDRLKDSALWQDASRDAPADRDAMHTSASQPHVEFWNTECYSPKYMFKDFPGDNQYAFAMATTFFSPRSRGEVTLASTDPTANPKVQHNFLSDPLDMLVFSEGCRMANEIALEGSGTKDVIVGSWPEVHGHSKFTTRGQWEGAIRQRADTCECALVRCCLPAVQPTDKTFQAITPAGAARWAMQVTRWRSSMQSSVCMAYRTCALLMRVSCRCFRADTRRWLCMPLPRSAPT
jgi:hypothetical protein